MVKISNIDAAVEFILREARTRVSENGEYGITQVLHEINEKLFVIIDNIQREERKEKEKEKQTGWNKGM